MATKKTASEKPAAPAGVPGRALVDLPAHGLRCGEYGSLPEDAAASLIAAGKFDPKAVQG